MCYKLRTHCVLFIAWQSTYVQRTIHHANKYSQLWTTPTSHSKRLHNTKIVTQDDSNILVDAECQAREKCAVRLYLPLKIFCFLRFIFIAFAIKFCEKKFAKKFFCSVKYSVYELIVLYALLGMKCTQRIWNIKMKLEIEYSISPVCDVVYLFSFFADVVYHSPIWSLKMLRCDE